MLLNGKWTVQGLDENNFPITFDGVVPGCVHADMLRNGIIKDIYYRDNSKTCQWVENRDFTYTREFEVEALEKNAYLEFDGLDTYCDIFLNGRKIGEAEDMFTPFAFPVDGYLIEGKNTIEVRFRSPVKEVASLPLLPGAFTRERLRTRRMQCTYFWDWVDRFVTMGIYRDVRLVFRKGNEIDNAYVYTKSINPYSAQIKLDINIRDVVPETEDITIEIYGPDGELVFKKKRTILMELLEEHIDIVEPKLWYPNGYGEHPIYKLVLTTPNSQKTIKFGIRELVILQIEDKEGSDEQKLCREIQSLQYVKAHDRNESTACFTVLCNGTKIMCKGGNWVPCEPFPSEETPEKITRLLELAVSGGVNMLRVWGGGIFEREEFYDECDRLGILVTQDFLMACGTYPEKEEWFIKALNNETKAAALRLRNHACLAWWSGDNENAVNGSENRTDFPGYYAATYGIQPVLRQYDPQRYFLASSPYGGDEYSSATRGTTHNTFYLGAIFWRIRETDLSTYREFFSSMFSRFSAEQSAFGLAFASCLKKFMTDEDIYGEDQSISEFHMKNNPALGLTLFEYVNVMSKKIFGDYTDGYDRVRKQQMLQCEWIRVTFEAHRRNKWFSSGIIYWMYNDCWPAANGWSIVDYYANPKPAYYTFKRCAQPVVASIEEKNGSANVYVSNDALEACSGKGKLYLYDFKADKNVYEKEFSFDVAENIANKVYTCDYNEIVSKMTSTTVLICDVETNLGSDRAFFIKDRFCDLDIEYTDVEVLSRTDTEITVRAKEFTPYVMLDEEKLMEENCFMLKKGETKTVKFINL